MARALAYCSSTTDFRLGGSCALCILLMVGNSNDSGGCVM